MTTDKEQSRLSRLERIARFANANPEMTRAEQAKACGVALTTWNAKLRECAAAGFLVNLRSGEKLHVPD